MYVLRILHVVYLGTWLQRLSPADVSTAELARRCSCRKDTLVDDVECALSANKDLYGTIDCGSVGQEEKKERDIRGGRGAHP